MSYYRNNRKNYQTSRKKMSSKRIDVNQFVKKATISTKEVYQNVNSFMDFSLDPKLTQNINQLGLINPTPIQDQTIPAGLKKQDVIGIANTGTGKTAAFLIPVINRLINEKDAYAIIMAPTRELAEQIQQQYRQLAKETKLVDALLIGGMGIMPQIRQLKYKPEIIIGTPGRIKDHINRQSLNLNQFNIVVLDEVDRMLEMGFVEDIKAIIHLTKPQRQNFCFSATLNSSIKSIITTITNDPLYVTINSSQTSENVNQDIIKYSDNTDKINKLHDLLIQNNTTKVLIFDDTKRNVEKLATDLSSRGFSTDSIHGNKSQYQRQQVLQRFKDNKINVLVATDVAARGLDVRDISHVINYSLPQTFDDYIHRIGRTGRADKTGSALTFVNQ